MERFVTPYDAARILNITPSAVHQMIRRGALSADGLLERGTYLIRREAVESMAMERLASTNDQVFDNGEATESESEREDESNG
jgi:Mn-dependent DtxR family transcriptional regulator